MMYQPGYYVESTTEAVSEEPSAKKLKLETAPTISEICANKASQLRQDMEQCNAGLPAKDWFEEYIQTCDRDYENILEVKLEFDDCTASVIRVKENIRVLIREIKRNVQNKITACHAVLLTPGTFYELIEKLPDFNCKYPSASFIANNQLSVFCTGDGTQLQQMFHKKGVYTLKPNFVRLFREQLDILRHNSNEMKACIKNAIFEKSLPKHILKAQESLCTREQHLSVENSKKSLLSCLTREMSHCVNTFYYCDGCVYDHCSQRRHPCMMDSACMKYRSVSEKSFFHLNMYNIATKLAKECLCGFDEAIFNTLTERDFIDCLKDMFQRELGLF